jgi:hypothetical protein
VGADHEAGVTCKTVGVEDGAAPFVFGPAVPGARLQPCSAAAAAVVRRTAPAIDPVACRDSAGEASLSTSASPILDPSSAMATPKIHCKFVASR